jgi:hypothetical protein
MKVVNVAGFDVKIEKNGKSYMILNDGQLHFIPDECIYDNYQGLLRVIVPPVQMQKVINNNEISQKIDFAEPIISEIKEIQLQEQAAKDKKVLLGVKLDKGTRIKLRKTRPTGPKAKRNKELEVSQVGDTNGNSN